MPLPAFRHSKSKVRRRRSHDALKTIMVSKCAKCQAPSLPHRVCKVCGVYAGRQVIGGMEEVKKTLKKTASKKEKIAVVADPGIGQPKVAKKPRATKAKVKKAEAAAETK